MKMFAIFMLGAAVLVAVPFVQEECDMSGALRRAALRRAAVAGGEVVPMVGEECWTGATPDCVALGVSYEEFNSLPPCQELEEEEF